MKTRHTRPKRKKREKCSTGHAKYPDRGTALLGAASISNMRHTTGAHAFKCHHCGMWHVTGKAPRRAA